MSSHLPFSIIDRYEQLSSEKKDRYGYEERFIRFLENMVNDADRKIRKAEEQAEIQNAVVRAKPNPPFPSFFPLCKFKKRGP